MRLNKFQREWIKKLRSGKTRKCVGDLANSSGGYCCLGVACRMADIPVIVLRYGDGSLSKMETVQEDLRLKSDVGRIDLSLVKPEWLERFKESGVDSLATMNDCKSPRFTHEEIGKFIDENREAVFNEA